MQQNANHAFTNKVLTSTLAWISNAIHYKVCDEITYPFPSINGAAVEVLGMDN